MTLWYYCTILLCTDGGDVLLYRVQNNEYNIPAGHWLPWYNSTYTNNRRSCCVKEIHLVVLHRLLYDEAVRRGCETVVAFSWISSSPKSWQWCHKEGARLLCDGRMVVAAIRDPAAGLTSLLEVVLLSRRWCWTTAKLIIRHTIKRKVSHTKDNDEASLQTTKPGWYSSRVCNTPRIEHSRVMVAARDVSCQALDGKIWVLAQVRIWEMKSGYRRYLYRLHRVRRMYRTPNKFFNYVWV